MLPLNTLFIISDEHQRDTIACCGHGVVKTPDIDRLAEEGTLFENT
jgi:choline-sulfatase